MKYLLDTHVILWILIDDGRVPKDIKEKLLNSNNQVYYSTVSPWEVEIKHQKQKNFTLSAKQFCFLCDQNDILNMPIKNDYVIKLKDIVNTDKKLKYNDPFDKMLLAQSLQENMTLITHDKKLMAYNTGNVILI